MYKYLITSFILVFFTLTGCENGKKSINNLNGITKVENGYMLAIPNQIADKIKQAQNAKLTLQSSNRAEISVQGQLKRVSGGLLLDSRETLDIPRGRSDFGIILHDPNTPAASCLAPEFGIGCFLAAPCAGTVYCLPGNGPGGFVCNCI